MKKILSMAMALVMLLGVMVIGVSADDPAVDAPVARGYQLTKVYGENDARVYDVRFIATVSEGFADFAKVGFVVTATNTTSGVNKMWTLEGTVVYGSLTGTTATGEVIEAISASSFEGAEALMAFTISGVPADLELTFTVTPYLKDALDEKLNGDTKTIAKTYEVISTSDIEGVKLTATRDGGSKYPTSALNNGDTTGSLYKNNSSAVPGGSNFANGFFIQYDFGSIKNFDKLVVYGRGTSDLIFIDEENNNTGFELGIFVSDNGTDWEKVDVTDEETITKTHTFTFPVQSARYIKLVYHLAKKDETTWATQINLYEADVYGACFREIVDPVS